MDIASAQRLWDGQPGWLNTASYGLPPRVGWDALQAALAQWQQGTGVWEEWQAAVEETRGSFARLLGVAPDQVFSGSTVSAALGLVAGAVPDGATVLVPDFEFASDVFPWRAHADRGVTLVGAPLADLADRIDSDVDVVAFALVQSASGEVADLPAVSAAARDVGALVVVDATQALGWLPFDVRLVDACVAATYKWLMTPRGATMGYFSPELQDRVRPAQTGWSAATDDFYYGLGAEPFADARRFDQAPAWFTHVAAAPTLRLLEEIGVAAINDHDVALANRFRSGIGLEPADSAIVSADLPGAEERLAAAGVRASARGGRVRVSFHVYSTPDDVDRALDALDGLRPR
ncbi:MAG TPA: aminotransferase class V-fold PLP-dependent enzyme [Nocardioides sp.]|nr:aminotransferase class V-fold PLP-dependent enzyme [Nocardioides sp.]